MHPALAHQQHRPWPLPAGSWKWRLTWEELGFVHYRIDARQLRPLLPAPLAIQEFDGSAWLGVVPFRMRDVMYGTWPGMPTLRAFPELNLRTYVECEGRPGVWFFSLDAESWPLVLGARLLFGLPYFKAGMTHRRAGDDGWEFTSRRRAGDVRFEARYGATGPEFLAEPGSFAHWATERYCLYSRVRGNVLRLEVHHAPWPLRAGFADLRRNDLFAAAGLAVPRQDPHCLFSAGVKVVTYAPVKVAG